MKGYMVFKKVPKVKVSRIAEMPEIYRTKPKKNKKIKAQQDMTIPPEQKFETEHNNLSRLLYARLYFLNKGKYKQYKQAKIMYADYAVKNYEAVKTLPKEKVPTISVWGLSPLIPFYAIRYARILITDIFRKKTPAEKQLAKLAKEEISKRKPSKMV